MRVDHSVGGWVENDYDIGLTDLAFNREEEHAGEEEAAQEVEDHEVVAA